MQRRYDNILILRQITLNFRQGLKFFSCGGRINLNKKLEQSVFSPGLEGEEQELLLESLNNTEIF